MALVYRPILEWVLGSVLQVGTQIEVQSFYSLKKC